MKKFISLFLCFAVIFCLSSCKNSEISGDNTASATISGTPNTETFKPDDIDYSKYDFLGRGEELIDEIEEKYKNYTVKYILEGETTTKFKLESLVNLMAYYDVNRSEKTVTVNIDTIEVRAHFDYTSFSAKSGDFAVIEFVTNLPTKFIASIGEQGSTKGETFHEGITPEGKDGIYKGKIKLTVPFVEAGSYYLNLSIDSGNAGFPFLLSIPFEIAEGEMSDNEYKLLFSGDWDLITAEGYKDSLTRLFYDSYPKLYARFGQGDEPKTITFSADKNYDGVAYCVGTMIVVSVDYANSNPKDIGFFSHEITHSVQQYDKLNYGDDAWWTENMANYGGFRYFHWANYEHIQVYSADDTSLQDWGYEPYGNNKWFFAYMDAKYPTVKGSDGKLKLGLIDSINMLIKNSKTMLNDNPYNTSSEFNKTVKDVTGFDCIEDLRLKFVEELKNKTWKFVGFKDYKDNFLTENLPNVEECKYPTISEPVHGNVTAASEEAFSGDNNLCKDATVTEYSGFVNNSERADYLIDGKRNTKWCSTGDTVSNLKYGLDGTLQWVVIDLGSEKSFNTYTVFNTKTVEAGYGNMTEWELLISNDNENWTSVDYQPNCNKNTASFNIGNQKARYLLLRIYNPDNNEAGTIRLYEFELYNK